MPSTCRVEGCSTPITQDGHTLCLAHWKLNRNKQLPTCARCGKLHQQTGRLCRECTASAPQAGRDDSTDDAPAGLLSSTRIGSHFGISNVKTNLILAELGWIEKYVKGWIPTEQGNKLGAHVRELRSGVPYVVWPDAILKNAALQRSITEQSGGPPAGTGNASPSPASAPAPSSASADTDDFRTKFPANFRTQDGHMVRSRAEVLIDNWLYVQGIVHAYERRLPIEEDCYCDFYLPAGKGVYIEYWGLEADPKYAARQAAKRAIYHKHNLRLIELGDAEIERLDDVLPRMLLRFGIESA